MGGQWCILLIYSESELRRRNCIIVIIDLLTFVKLFHLVNKKVKKKHLVCIEATPVYSYLTGQNIFPRKVLKLIGKHRKCIVSADKYRNHGGIFLVYGAPKLEQN